MANHGVLSTPADGGSQQQVRTSRRFLAYYWLDPFHSQPIPVLYQSRHGNTPEGTPISCVLYFTPLPPSAPTPRPAHEDGATKVLCLTRMFSPDRLGDDVYYRNCCWWMTVEGRKHGGKLVRVVIPRPDPSGAPVAGVGNVFLEYANLDSSTYSKTMLHLTWFRGRRVIASFYPEDKFANGDYDG